MSSKIFILCLALAAVKGQIQDVTTYNISAERTDDYINSNRLQYRQVIQGFDAEMANYRQRFTENLNTLRLQRDMTIASVVRMEERLYSLELLGDTSKACVVKYRQVMMSVSQLETGMNACITQLSVTLEPTLTGAITHRNAVFTILNTNFEAELNRCRGQFATTSGNYTSCITVIISTTNSNVVAYKKTFSNLIDAANCAGKANQKVAVDCILTNQDMANSRTAECNVLINKCIMGQDECKPCPAACPESSDSQVDFANETIPNPFYGSQDVPSSCVLNVKPKTN